MDYSKRNKIRSEIDILIERLEILQWQVSYYDDKTAEINILIDNISKEKESFKKVQKQVKECSVTKDNLSTDISILESNKRQIKASLDDIKTDIVESNKILHNQKKREEDFIIRSEGNIERYKLEEKEYRTKKQNALIDYNSETNKLKYNKIDLINDIDNLNKEKLDVQDELNTLSLKRTDLKNDYQELDKSYQDLLELYILKI